MNSSNCNFQDIGGRRDRYELGMKEIVTILHRELTLGIVGGMACASKLSVDNARNIHRKLNTGEIHWVALMKSQCKGDLTGAASSTANAAVFNAAVPSIASIVNATVTAATKAAVPSIANTAVPSVL
ncbi:hypothetical protein MSAN_01062400 [Mycena sanguinolenta]|uniref:Uncharacterized protein n=1 Tax=Mycena sanguinolenta TaxID=230812 RepID=A0A8H6YRU8_9AGAR|nr:hypothetical protein MSAN_01062400 [Mycena sanguinolenta]